jgi:hypothetical protein
VEDPITASTEFCIAHWEEVAGRMGVPVLAAANVA